MRRTKVITGTVLALFIASMLSTTATAVHVPKPGAFFVGNVTWGMPGAFGYDAWGKVYARAKGDMATAFGWFFVPEIKASIHIMLVEVEVVEVGEDTLYIFGLWDCKINNEFVGDMEACLMVNLFPEEFPETFGIWPGCAGPPFVWGDTMSLKTWGIDAING